MAMGQLFSLRFGYAIHSLVYMAKKPLDTLTTLSELAAWMRTVWPSISMTYLSNVVQRLTRGGLLRSHRGVAGGYSLARSPERITLWDVTEVINGVWPDQWWCPPLTTACPGEGLEAIQDILLHVEEQHRVALQRVTCADLAYQLTVREPCESPMARSSA